MSTQWMQVASYRHHRNDRRGGARSSATVPNED
jgi:hypothetical protein